VRASLEGREHRPIDRLRVFSAAEDHHPAGAAQSVAIDPERSMAKVLFADHDFPDLRLERDRWTIRAPEFRRYRASVASSLDRLDRLKTSLEDIKALAGSGPWALGNILLTAARVLKTVSAIEPPDELQAAHALLVGAAQMADAAAKIRREAALTGSMARAWDASAAAAGSLMLGGRARSEIRDILNLPQPQR